MYVTYKDGSVVTAVYMDAVPEKMTEKGIEVDGEMPKPKDMPNLRPVLKVNVEKAKLYYDYERPDSIEDRIKDMQQTMTELMKKVKLS